MEMGWIEKHYSNGFFENTECLSDRQLRTCGVLLGTVFRSDNGCKHLNLFKRHVKGFISQSSGCFNANLSL